MTIGQLSRRTGVPIKTLREYERLGFLYTLGRSESNYRLFGDEAVWCVQVTQGFRSLGLTFKQIQELSTHYLEHPDTPMDSLLAEHLTHAAARVESQIADLRAIRQRIRDFQAALTGRRAPSSMQTSSSASAFALVRLLASDPQRDAVQSASS
jgi:DNA-binding transcriptional MerR regulator